MKHLIGIFIASSLLLSCGRFGKKDEKQEQSERIVCISKQYNEIIYALGAEEDIVAADISSTYPPQIKELPTVGYHRALSTEGILAAKPTLILHDNNIGPEHVVQQITALKIPTKVFGKYNGDIRGTDSLIREMGAYFHKERAADSLCAILDKDMEQVLEKAKQYGDTQRVLVIHYGRASNVYLIMTAKSTAARMLAWAGGRMAVDGARGMKQMSPEVIAASDPDVILLTDFGYDRLGSLEKVKALPGIAGTKAATNNRIYRVEEHDLVYMGPRTGKVAARLQKLLHDETAAK